MYSTTSVTITSLPRGLYKQIYSLLVNNKRRQVKWFDRLNISRGMLQRYLLNLGIDRWIGQIGSITELHSTFKLLSDIHTMLNIC